jgi:hypothetical protein
MVPPARQSSFRVSGRTGAPPSEPRRLPSLKLNFPPPPAGVVCCKNRQRDAGTRTGTSARARPVTRGHSRHTLTALFAGQTCSRDGREGVDGSSPTEGFAKFALIGRLCLAVATTCRGSVVHPTSVCRREALSRNDVRPQVERADCPAPGRESLGSLGRSARSKWSDHVREVLQGSRFGLTVDDRVGVWR